jgi:hypothetical protein
MLPRRATTTAIDVYLQIAVALASYLAEDRPALKRDSPFSLSDRGSLGERTPSPQKSLLIVKKHLKTLLHHIPRLSFSQTIHKKLLSVFFTQKPTRFFGLATGLSNKNF